MYDAGDFVVFLSYSRKDELLQLTLEQAIASLAGVRVWSDSMIGMGQGIHENIAQAISQSDCVLVLLTEPAAASPEVREELVRADIRKIPIIVVKEDSVAENRIPYFLRDRRYLSYDANAMQARRLAEIVRDAVLQVRDRAASRPGGAPVSP